MERIKFKTDKLRGRAIEKFGSLDKLSSALNWNQATMGAKFRGRRDFKTSEVVTLVKALDIPMKDVASYFLEEVK